MVTQPAPQPDPTDEPTEMENLTDLAGKLFQVPKEEVDDLRRREKSDRA